jgi:IMP dehydrogenase/GMP reductase
MEVEIGRGKKGRRAYGFDDIAIVPSRRTRDPDDIDITWTLGPYRFELPLLASAMDGVVSPKTAGLIGNLGGLGVLNLEGTIAMSSKPYALRPFLPRPISTSIASPYVRSRTKKPRVAGPEMRC